MTRKPKLLQVATILLVGLAFDVLVSGENMASGFAEHTAPANSQEIIVPETIEQEAMELLQDSGKDMQQLGSGRRLRKYKGCFNDNTDGKRDLPVFKGVGKDKNACDSACSGYKYFGRQWTKECWCGNSYGSQKRTTGCKCAKDNIGGSKNCVYATASEMKAKVAKKKDPCAGKQGKTNIGAACMARVWKAAGCTTPAPYGNWHSKQRYEALVKDAGRWSTLRSKAHKKRCYGAGYTKKWIKKYSRKYPHCKNNKCLSGKTRAQMEAECNKYTTCTGFSFSAGASSGGGCLKKCGAKEFGGYGSGPYDYWKRPPKYNKKRPRKGSKICRACFQAKADCVKAARDPASKIFRTCVCGKDNVHKKKGRWSCKNRTVWQKKDRACRRKKDYKEALAAWLQAARTKCVEVVKTCDAKEKDNCKKTDKCMAAEAKCQIPKRKCRALARGAWLAALRQCVCGKPGWCKGYRSRKLAPKRKSCPTDATVKSKKDAYKQALSGKCRNDFLECKKADCAGQ